MKLPPAIPETVSDQNTGLFESAAMLMAKKKTLNNKRTAWQLLRFHSLQDAYLQQVVGYIINRRGILVADVLWGEAKSERLYEAYTSAERIQCWSLFRR
jgi:hypothetical protein